MKEIMKRLFVKLTSSKVLITIAAVVLLYIIVIGNRTEFKEVAYICASVIPCYVAGNVIQHKTGSRGDEK